MLFLKKRNKNKKLPSGDFDFNLWNLTLNWLIFILQFTSNLEVPTKNHAIAYLYHIMTTINFDHDQASWHMFQGQMKVLVSIYIPIINIKYHKEKKKKKEVKYWDTLEIWYKRAKVPIRFYIRIVE